MLTRSREETGFPLSRGRRGWGNDIVVRGMTSWKEWPGGFRKQKGEALPPPFDIHVATLLSRDGLAIVEGLDALAAVIGRLIQNAFALGDDGRDEGLPGDVDRRAAHVEDRVDGEQ